jgi:hypothetical protein
LAWSPRTGRRLSDVGVDGDEVRDRTDRAWTTATFRRVPGKEEGLEAMETTWMIAELEENRSGALDGWKTPVRPA